MTTRRGLAARSILFCRFLVVLSGWLLASPTKMEAQTKGNNAVWSSSGGVSGSSAFIDASAFYTGKTGLDICQIINGILTSTIIQYPATGAVIDARGIAAQTPQNCTGNPFQGSGGSGTLVNVPSTVLLPATDIKMTSTWVLPSNTKIVGEGSHTILLAESGVGTDMLEMGSPTGCATAYVGISIERLQLDGTNVPSVNGIANYCAQDASYVDGVNLVGIGGTGLLIEGPSANWAGANGSGPYSNINFSGATACTQSTCACIQIEAQTRGVREATCVAKPTNVSPWAAIYLDASNNSIEDVHIEGFYDGVVVGDNKDQLNIAPTNNTIVNVTGADGRGPVQNAVHICKPSGTYGSSTACNAQSQAASDLAILNVTSVGSAGAPTFSATTILDDLTGTEVNSSKFSASVAIYDLGEQVGAAGQYSRFTTYPLVPTWGVGGAITTGSACATPGALYSNTQGGHLTSVYVCTYGASGWQWQPIS